MVGGPVSSYEAALPYLKNMGKNIVHCGDNGTGQVGKRKHSCKALTIIQVAKICNNLVLSISMIAVAEGMSLGVKLGMDPVKLAGIMNTSSGRCWSSDTYNPCPGVCASLSWNEILNAVSLGDAERTIITWLHRWIWRRLDEERCRTGRCRRSSCQC